MAEKLAVKTVRDTAFSRYGKVVEGIDVSDIIEAMGDTPLPDSVAYEPSVKSLESCTSAGRIAASLYGGMPIQIGYCNGNNYLLNALEYHRDSEVNIAVTDIILLLGCEQDVGPDYTYDTELVEAFLVPAGTVIEVYGTTLHYAPCNAAESGFKAVVILPRGTNTDLLEEEKPEYTPEDKLLFARNKWLIAHPDSGLEADGAFIGLRGDNISVR